MRCRTLLALCICFLCLASCNDDDDPDIIVNVEDDFYVDIFEDISNGEQRFQLNLTSIKELECLNYSIDYLLDFNETNNTVTLSINDLVEPELCIDGNAQAKVMVPFGNLSEGAYLFNLNLKDAIKNTGRLNVSSDYYELLMNTEDGVELLHEKLWRIPDGTVWGNIEINSSDDEADAAYIVSQMNGLEGIDFVNQNSAYPSGYYGYFELDEDKDIKILGEGLGDHRPFIYTYQGESTNLVDFISEICTQLPDLKMELSLANGQIITCN